MKALHYLPLAFITLTACSTTPEPTIRTVEVRVPVAISCVPPETPNPPARIPIPEETGPAIQAMAEELLRWRAYGEQTEAILSACRGG